MNIYRNDALLAGHLVENFEFHHRNGTQKIFEGKMEVERKSGKKDIVILQMPEEKLKLMEEFKEGDPIFVSGEIRTHKYMGYDEKPHCKVYVYVSRIYLTTNTTDLNNTIRVTGKLIKKETFRKNHYGKEITGAIISTKSNCGHRYAYVPVIFWGDLAEKIILNYEVGDEIRIKGKFQSRDYIKRTENEIELRTSFEVSASKIIL